MKSQQLQRLALVGLLFLLAAIAIVIREPSANQYEISLYGAYPGYFWIFTMISIAIGASVILVSTGKPDDSTWVFGLMLILLTNLLLLLLPYARGYMMYGRHDAMTHLGYVISIRSVGEVGSNIYPPMHLLNSAIADATSTEPMTTAMFVPLLFSILYFGSIFYLVRFLFSSRKQILFSLPFAMLPVLGSAFVGFRPFDLAVLFVPLVLYLFMKSQHSSVFSVQTVFVIVFVSSLLYHPLTALYTVGIFIFYVLGRYTPRIKAQYATPTNVLSLSAAVFLAWYTNFTGIIIRFRNNYASLFGAGGDGPTPAEGYTETVEQASPEFIDLTRVVLFRYGVEFVLFGLGFAFIALSLLLLSRRRFSLDVYAFMFSGMLILFSIGGLLFLFLDLSADHTRPWQLAKIVSVLLAGQFFYLLWNHVEWDQHSSSLQSGFRISLTVAFLLILVLSMVSLYPSPGGSESNQQVTEAELQGTEWFTEHGNETGSGLFQFDISYHRYHAAQYGVSAQLPEWGGGTSPPDHFNYTEFNSFGDSHTSDQYIIINDRGRMHYPGVFPNYPEQWRLTPADFDRLEQDKTIARVYDNGGYNQYLIDGASED